MGLDDITYTTEYRAKTFVSLPLSNCKFEGVVAYANNVLDVKNLISIYIVNHYEDFIVGDALFIINEKDFITMFHQKATAIPARWEEALKKAEANEDAEKVAMEESKLSAAKECAGKFEELFQ